MPRTKLSKALEAEQIRNEDIEAKLSKALARGPMVKIPGSPYSVDLLTGIMYLDEKVLKEIRFQHRFMVDTDE